MKFKLVEKFDETRSIVQDYMYDAMDELNNASLEEYIQWFKDNLTAYPEDIEQAVTDAYIESCDYGMIKGVEKTRLTSELKEYIESHTDIIDDTDELMRQCPEHLQHELKIVLSKLDESFTEQLFESSYLSIPKNLTQFIEEHADLLDTDVDQLYLLCPIGLKASLLEVLHIANIDVDKDLVRKVKFLTSEYTNSDLDILVMDNGGYLGTTTNNIEYIITNWNKFDFPKYDSLNESTLEEAIRPDLKRFIEQHAKLLDDNNIEELYKQCPRELKIPLVRILKAASLGDNIKPIKRATFLADFYDDDELINLVLSVGEHANDVFDAFDYIMNNWDEFFTDDMLNEELLTEEQVMYKVTHPKYPEPVFFNVTKTVDKTTEEDTTNDIAERKLEAIFDSLEHKKKVNGETPNYDLLAKLINCDEDLANYTLSPSPETKLTDLTKITC